MTPEQSQKYQEKRSAYERQTKSGGHHTMQEVALLVMSDAPDDWYFTWELMGSTKYGWLSHATHATLRVLEQDGLIRKDYIDQFVVYTTTPAGMAIADRLKNTELLEF